MLRFQVKNNDRQVTVDRFERSFGCAYDIYFPSVSLSSLSAVRNRRGMFLVGLLRFLLPILLLFSHMFVDPKSTIPGR